jgi:hypothetical protein
MKITNNSVTRLFRPVLLAVVAGLALLANSVAADEKGAEKLMKLQNLNTVADVQKVAAGDTVVMSCPKCKDSWATVVQTTGKAANPSEARNVVRHACPGCGTKIVTEGAGKQAQDKVVHTCKHCGSKDAFCCVMKKGAAPTKGMEESQAHQH